MPPCIVEEEVCFVFLFNIFFNLCTLLFCIPSTRFMRNEIKIYFFLSFLQFNNLAYNFPFNTTNTGMRKSFLKGNVYTIAE